MSFGKQRQTDNRGVARNLAMEGGKILDRKPHLLINTETGSNYYSVRVPAKHILSNNNEQRNIDELGVTVEVTRASYSLGGSEPT